MFQSSYLLKILLAISLTAVLTTSGVLQANTGPITGKTAATYLRIEGNGGYENCSGVIVHPKLLLTASHCIDSARAVIVRNHVDNHGNNYQTGRLFIKIQSSENGVDYDCHSSSNCSSYEPFWYARLIRANTNDVSKDIAYIYRPQDFNNTPDSYPVLDTGGLNHAPFSFFGAGRNQLQGAGTVRRTNGLILSAAEKSFSYESGSNVLCFGDSGGAYFHQNTNLVIGIFSKFNPMPICSGNSGWPFYTGTTEYAYKINQSTIEWINWALETSDAWDSPRCETIPHSASRFDCSGTFESDFSEVEQCRLECQNFYFSQFPFNESGYLSCLEDC